MLYSVLYVVTCVMQYLIGMDLLPIQEDCDNEGFPLAG